MKYEELRNWGPEKRTVILPQTSFPGDKQPPPSLGDIRLINVRKCPIGKNCVTIEDAGYTSFCPYMGTYPGTSMGGESVLTTLACLHPKAPTHLEVSSLIAYCPRNTQACIDRGTRCEYLENVLTPWQVSGPHYHVMCQRGQEGQTYTFDKKYASVKSVV
jgi:hypothetical protein